MRRKEGKRHLRFSGQDAYSMCQRKKKFKSNEASKIADKFNQRKYQCPICEHWHLTKAKEGTDNNE